MKRISILMVLVMVLAIFTGCEKDSSKGSLKLSITDAPIDSDGITGVHITITDVQYKLNDNSFVSFEGFEGPQEINLLDLTRGVTDLLGTFELEAGKYSQLRFILDAPGRDSGVQANAGCFLEFEDGTTQPLFVPSGAQSGYKAVGEFTVPSNGTVEITADFDVRKSVVKAGASGMYILKPTIRLVVDNQAGRIVGNVTNAGDSVQVVVYAYEDGKFAASEADEPTAETPRFPNAVSSDLVDESGLYHIDFLAPMSYDLVIVSNVDGAFGQVLGIVEDVVVESRKTTTTDIDLSSF